MFEKYPDLFEASKRGYSDAHSEGLRARFCAEGTLKQIIGVNAEWHLQSLSTLKIKQKHIVSGLWHMWILSLFLSRRVHSRPQVAQQVLADDSSPASPRRQRDLRSFCFSRTDPGEGWLQRKHLACWGWHCWHCWHCWHGE